MRKTLTVTYVNRSNNRYPLYYKQSRKPQIKFSGDWLTKVLDLNIGDKVTLETINNHIIISKGDQHAQ